MWTVGGQGRVGVLAVSSVWVSHGRLMGQTDTEPQSLPSYFQSHFTMETFLDFCCFIHLTHAKMETNALASKLKLIQ